MRMAFTLDGTISLEDIAALLAFALAFWGAWRAIRDVSRQLRDVTYAELDRLYFDLQRAALDYPAASIAPPLEGRDKRSIKNRRRYEIYAGMVWNLVETVDDRCDQDANLKRTWFPVLEVEKRRHEAWIRKPQNAALFKEDFRRKHCI